MRNRPTTCPPTPEKGEHLCFLTLHPLLSLLAASAGFPVYFLWENTFPSVLPSLYWGHTICCFIQVLISPVLDVCKSYLYHDFQSVLIIGVASFMYARVKLPVWDPEIGHSSGCDSLVFWINVSFHHPGQDWVSSWVGHLMLLEGAKAALCSPRAFRARR